MKYLWIALCALLLMAPVASACDKSEKDGGLSCHHKGEHTKSCALKHRAGTYFISPSDGETVSGKVRVKMGVKGMKVHKAGSLIDGTGHHHLIVDGSYVPETKNVPKDAQHIHFGKGQSETEIELAPGKHTLTLQFANGLHQSYGKVFSHTIQITVK
ncbi:MAG: DUF4399 domain-containing protein [Mariprofundaceae bacterium]